MGVSVGFVAGMLRVCGWFFFFFFNDTATTEIYTLSLHDALPILPVETGGGTGEQGDAAAVGQTGPGLMGIPGVGGEKQDRKSTRLNSSHGYISYAVFCLKKKKPERTHNRPPHSQSKWQRARNPEC